MSVTRRRSPAATDGDTAERQVTGRARWWHRTGRAALIVAAGTAALALAGPMALRPFVDAAGAAGAAGDVAVAFVIDFGTGSTPVVGCVKVPASDNRYQALSAFTAHEGMAPPTYASSGLLCSINVVPSSGCGQVVSGGYIYWSYFTGGPNGWVYASTGAFGQVGTDDVEGWRFQDPGTGRPNDPPPRATWHYDSICRSGSTTTSTTQPTSTGKGGKGGGGGTGAGTGAGGTAHRTHAHKGATAVAGKTGASTTTTTTSAPATATTTFPTTTFPPDTDSGLVNKVHSGGSGGSGPGPDPLIVGGLLVAVLAIAAYTRWRRRPHAR